MKNARAISRFNERQRLLAVERKNYASKYSLINFSHASQIGLFILAVFGYFYTVQPVYTKALLEESIAKNEIELRELKKLVGKEKDELDKMQKELQLATATVDAQAKKIAQGKMELAEQYQRLRLAALSALKVHLQSQCSFFLINASISGVVDRKLIESVATCLGGDAEKEEHFKALSKEDKAEIRAQTKSLSEKFSALGAKILLEQTHQEKQIDTSNQQRELAIIKRKGEQLKMLLNEALKGIESLSLSKSISS